MSRRSREVPDDLLAPTPERQQHGRLTTEQVARTYGVGERVRGMAFAHRETLPDALHRLAVRFPQDIRRPLLMAGEQLRTEWLESDCEPRCTAAYSPFGTQGEEPDAPLSKTVGVGAALAAIPLHAARSVVSYVILSDIEDSRVDLLKVGLTALCRHYRIDCETDMEKAERIRKQGLDETSKRGQIGPGLLRLKSGTVIA